jgi:formate/nitrite transporter FocA (FNT family)
MSFNCYTPKEAMEIVGRSGYIKANMRLDKVFFSSVNAGFVLAFACATALSTNSSPWYQVSQARVKRS